MNFFPFLQGESSYPAYNSSALGSLLFPAKAVERTCLFVMTIGVTMFRRHQNSALQNLHMLHIYE